MRYPLIEISAHTHTPIIGRAIFHLIHDKNSCYYNILYRYLPYIILLYWVERLWLSVIGSLDLQHCFRVYQFKRHQFIYLRGAYKYITYIL